MDKLIKTLTSLRPSQIMMYGGFGLLILASVGSIGGFSIIQGMEIPVLLVGLVLVLTGAYFAFVRARELGKKK